MTDTRQSYGDPGPVPSAAQPPALASELGSWGCGLGCLGPGPVAITETEPRETGPVTTVQARPETPGPHHQRPGYTAAGPVYMQFVRDYARPDDSSKPSLGFWLQCDVWTDIEDAARRGDCRL